MVSLVGLAATVATGSIVFRKLYQYYWKNPNISIFNNLLIRKTSSLRPLCLIFDKSSSNYSYSQVPISPKHEYISLLSTNHRQFLCGLNIQSLEYETNNRKIELIKNLLMNGIDLEIKKFIQINQNALHSKQYYQMNINLNEMKTMMEIQIGCQPINPSVEYISIEFEQLLDDNRDFLVFKQQSQGMKNSYLILSQDKQRPQFRYSPYEAQYLFISNQQLKNQIQSGVIKQIWETRNDNPIYKVVKNITIGHKTFTFQDYNHQKNKKRFNNILKYGDQYYKMKSMDI